MAIDNLNKLKVNPQKNVSNELGMKRVAPSEFKTLRKSDLLSITLNEHIIPNLRESYFAGSYSQKKPWNSSVRIETTSRQTPKHRTTESTSRITSGSNLSSQFKRHLVRRKTSSQRQYHFVRSATLPSCTRDSRTSAGFEEVNSHTPKCSSAVENEKKAANSQIVKSGQTYRQCHARPNNIECNRSVNLSALQSLGSSGTQSTTNEDSSYCAHLEWVIWKINQWYVKVWKNMNRLSCKSSSFENTLYVLIMEYLEQLKMILFMCSSTDKKSFESAKDTLVPFHNRAISFQSDTLAPQEPSDMSNFFMCNISDDESVWSLADVRKRYEHNRSGDSFQKGKDHLESYENFLTKQQKRQAYLLDVRTDQPLYYQVNNVTRIHSSGYEEFEPTVANQTGEYLHAWRCMKTDSEHISVPQKPDKCHHSLKSDWTDEPSSTTMMEPQSRTIVLDNNNNTMHISDLVGKNCNNCEHLQREQRFTAIHCFNAKLNMAISYQVKTENPLHKSISDPIYTTISESEYPKSPFIYASSCQTKFESGDIKPNDRLLQTKMNSSMEHMNLSDQDSLIVKAKFLQGHKRGSNRLYWLENDNVDPKTNAFARGDVEELRQLEINYSTLDDQYNLLNCSPTVHKKSHELGNSDGRQHHGENLKMSAKSNVRRIMSHHPYLPKRSKTKRKKEKPHLLWRCASQS